MTDDCTGPVRTFNLTLWIKSSSYLCFYFFYYFGRNIPTSAFYLKARCVPGVALAPLSAPALLLFVLTVARCGSCYHPQICGESWPAARMQQNGSSGSNGSDGCSRDRQALSFSPLPAATTRVRRFIQERRTLPLPRVMVVFSPAGDTEKPGDAMSSSDSAEDDFRKPASPAPSFTVSKPLRSPLNTQEQEVGRLTGLFHMENHFKLAYRHKLANNKPQR